MHREAVVAAVRVDVPNGTSELTCRMLAYMAHHCDTATLASVADYFGCHPNTVASRVRAALGRSFGDVLEDMRLQRGAALLEAGVGAAQAARLCGYGDPGRFKKALALWDASKRGQAANLQQEGGDGPMIGETRGRVGVPLTFEGYANDFDKTISAVQFSLDGGGTWTTYETPGTSNELNVSWTFSYTPQEPGAYELLVRSVNEDGTVSPHIAHAPFVVEP